MVEGKYKRKGRIILIISIMAVLVLAGVGFTRPDKVLAYLSDTPVSSTMTSSPVLPVIETQTPAPSQTMEIPPTITESVPIEPAQSSILISMLDEGYFQLYLYNPFSSSFTQLTTSPCDIITPAISPDGKSLAFSSNRDGFWDLYVLDISSNLLTKVTNTPQYDAAPAWSPDGKWLTYETYLDNNLEIQIISTDPGDTTIIRLTEDAGADHSPDWSPDGQYLVFVSNRTGDDDIWMADLHTIEDRFVNISNRSSSEDRDPVWSLEGNSILWSSAENGSTNILQQKLGPYGAEIVVTGSQPHHNLDGTTLLVIDQGPSDSLIRTYSLETRKVSSVPSLLPGMINGMMWIPDFAFTQLTEAVQKMDGNSTAAESDQPDSGSENQPGNINSLIKLEGVNVPNPYLVEGVVDSFSALQQQTEQIIGWNYLDNLENAFIPITQPPSPELADSWLFTGRAITINSSPLYGGWMSVVREDYNGKTYWRVFLKTRFQDGSQGMPLKTKVWDFTTRHSGDPMGYENGGSKIDTPEGYWIDFTALAQQFGWERTAALQDWRNYMDGTLFNEYVHDDNLSWQAAMLELYPPEALVTATRIPTQTPTVQVP